MSENTKRFTSRTAIVTGGGKGIGQAIVERLAAEGAKVAVWELDEEAGTDAVQAVTEAGGEAQAFACDVSDQASAQTAAQATVEPIDLRLETDEMQFRFADGALEPTMSMTITLFNPSTHTAAFRFEHPAETLGNKKAPPCACSG